MRDRTPIDSEVYFEMLMAGFFGNSPAGLMTPVALTTAPISRRATRDVQRQREGHPRYLIDCAMNAGSLVGGVRARGARVHHPR